MLPELKAVNSSYIFLIQLCDGGGGGTITDSDPSDGGLAMGHIDLARAPQCYFEVSLPRSLAAPVPVPVPLYLAILSL